MRSCRGAAGSSANVTSTSILCWARSGNEKRYSIDWSSAAGAATGSAASITNPIHLTNPINSQDLRRILSAEGRGIIR